MWRSQFRLHLSPCIEWPQCVSGFIELDPSAFPVVAVLPRASRRLIIVPPEIVGSFGCTGIPCVHFLGGFLSFHLELAGLGLTRSK